MTVLRWYSSERGGVQSDEIVPLKIFEDKSQYVIGGTVQCIDDAYASSAGLNAA
jgi:hypothetical protein